MDSMKVMKSLASKYQKVVKEAKPKTPPPKISEADLQDMHWQVKFRKTMALEKAGERSDRTLKEICKLLIEFKQICRFCELIETTPREELQQTELDPIKTLFQEIA